MIVELKPHYGRNVATRQNIYLNQSRIFVDGRAVGFISDRPGAVPMLVERFAPLDVEEIERQVLAQGGSGKVKSVPDVPAEMLEPVEEQITDDDFD